MQAHRPHSAPLSWEQGAALQRHGVSTARSRKQDSVGKKTWNCVLEQLYQSARHTRQAQQFHCFCPRQAPALSPPPATISLLYGGHQAVRSPSPAHLQLCAVDLGVWLPPWETPAPLLLQWRHPGEGAPGHPWGGPSYPFLCFPFLLLSSP